MVPVRGVGTTAEKFFATSWGRPVVPLHHRTVRMANRGVKLPDEWDMPLGNMNGF